MIAWHVLKRFDIAEVNILKFKPRSADLMAISYVSFVKSRMEVKMLRYRVIQLGDTYRVIIVMVSRDMNDNSEKC